MLLSFGQKDKDTPAYSSSLLNEITTYQYQNKLNKNLKVLDKAVKKAEDREDNKILAEAYCLYALLLLEEEDRETATFYWERAGALRKAQYDPYNQALHDYVAAKWHYSDGEFSKTLELLQKSKQRNTDNELNRRILLL